jgi:hypothetical protein
MGDAVQLTEYLRDYIWSIGITQMRTAAPGGESPVMPQTPSLPAGVPAPKTGELRGVNGPPTANR